MRNRSPQKRATRKPRAPKKLITAKGAQRAARGSALKAGKKDGLKTTQKPAQKTAEHGTEPTLAREPLTIGFVRGVSPDKWVQRWQTVRGRNPLNMVPVAHFSDPQTPKLIDETDLLFVRTESGSEPLGTKQNRHSVFLYTEKLALIVQKDHELAAEKLVQAEDLALIELIDYPDYDERWPKPIAWADPSYRPKNLRGALELVKAGIGVTIAPVPLARALIDKRDLKAVEIFSDSPADLPATSIFATWKIEKDNDDVQEFIGVLRGRGSNSSR